MTQKTANPPDLVAAPAKPRAVLNRDVFRQACILLGCFALFVVF